jgi:Na+/H+ antiporter NhaD/arsenite permease-like protein
MGPAICAVIMVISPFHILRPAYVLDQPGLMNIDTVATLFGLTIVTGCLKDFGAIGWSMRLLKRECSSPRALMGRVMVLTTVLSALVTNDACVLILTQPLLDVCEAMDVAPQPFLIALATTANLGSSWTLIGNPQNVLIASYSGMRFFDYMALMSPVVLVGLLLNYGFLLYFFREQLAGSFDTGPAARTPRPWPKHPKYSSPVLMPTAAEQDPEQLRLKQRLLFESEGGSPQPTVGVGPGMLTGPTTTAVRRSSPGEQQRNLFNQRVSPISGPDLELQEQQRRTALKIAGYATAMAIAFAFVFLGSIAWTVLVAVACMVLIDVYIQGGESERILGHVDGFLLVMISALFVVIAGARRTGVPETIYFSLGELCPDKHEFCHYDGKYDSLADVMMAAMLVLVLSNVCSNVPSVMLLGQILQSQQASDVDKTLGWLVLAWSATVAGNFTMVGSIANLIVAEKSAVNGHEMTFWHHLSFAGWSTLIVMSVGCFVLFFGIRPLLDMQFGDGSGSVADG